jgi:hypothetical protein
MVHFFKKGHFVDEQTLARVNTAVVLGPIASGWAACVIGALINDVGRLLSVW